MGVRVAREIDEAGPMRLRTHFVRICRICRVLYRGRPNLVILPVDEFRVLLRESPRTRGYPNLRTDANRTAAIADVR